MIQFNAVITLAGRGVLLEAEELDQEPDADGLSEFFIAADDRKSVIYMNMSYFRPPMLFTQEDAEDYFEKVNYPEQPPSYSSEEVFSKAELSEISQAIALEILKAHR